MKARIALVLLLVMLVCSFAAGKDKPGAACSQVQKSFEAWNSHDPDKVTAFYTADVVYEDVPYGEVAHGTAELRKLVDGFVAAVPDLKLEVVSCSADKNRGTTEWVFSGTDKGLYKTGKRFSVRGASLFELRGGKFAKNRDYYDSAAIMRQVGALPPANP